MKPPKLNPLALGWEFPPNDVFTENGLLGGGDPKEVGLEPKLKPDWPFAPEENMPPWLGAGVELAPGKLWL